MNSVGAKRSWIGCFGFAVRGLRVLFASEQNARIHAGATVAIVLVGMYFRISVGDWLWLTVAVTLVWATEAINTSIEFLTDLVSPGFDPLAEKAKDVAAGAVLVTAIGAVVIGILVFAPYVFGV